MLAFALEQDLDDQAALLRPPAPSPPQGLQELLGPLPKALLFEMRSGGLPFQDGLIAGNDASPPFDREKIALDRQEAPPPLIVAMGLSGLLAFFGDAKADRRTQGENLAGNEFFRQALDDEVFGETAGRKGKPGRLLGLADVFGPKEADLALDHAEMGIALDALSLDEDALGPRFFGFLPLAAGADRRDFGHLFRLSFTFLNRLIGKNTDSLAAGLIRMVPESL
jgi:hypothetical protein